jgi:hypothetical protein
LARAEVDRANYPELFGGLQPIVVMAGYSHLETLSCGLAKLGDISNQWVKVKMMKIGRLLAPEISYEMSAIHNQPPQLSGYSEYDLSACSEIAFDINCHKLNCNLLIIRIQIMTCRKFRLFL